MYIKRYAITALLFTLFIGWYVYAFITQESTSFAFFGIELPSFSIALWVIIPLLVLTLASVFHMFLYSFLGTLRMKKYEKDYDRLIDSVVDAYLGKKNREAKFKTQRYQLLGTLLDNSIIFPNDTLANTALNDKVDAVLKTIENIKNGEVVDLKKYALPVNNALVIQNNKNRYIKGDISANDILHSPAKYDHSLAEYVYVDYVKTASLENIERFQEFMSKEALFEILTRVNADKNILEVSNDKLISLFALLDLEAKDYVNISSLLASQMVPEQRMKLFETLSETKEEAIGAYLYTLFDLEMLAPADDILENSQPDEFLNFKSYRALKECNKNFNINLFI